MTPLSPPRASSASCGSRRTTACSVATNRSASSGSGERSSAAASSVRCSAVAGPGSKAGTCQVGGTGSQGSSSVSASGASESMPQASCSLRAALAMPPSLNSRSASSGSMPATCSGRGRPARADRSALAAFWVRAAPVMTSRSGKYSSPSAVAQRVPRPSRSGPSPTARAPRRRSACSRTSSSVISRSARRRPQSARSLGRDADSSPARQTSRRRSRGSRSRSSRSPRAPCGGSRTSTARLRCSSASALKGCGSLSPLRAFRASVVQATA